MIDGVTAICKEKRVKHLNILNIFLIFAVLIAGTILYLNYLKIQDFSLPESYGTASASENSKTKVKTPSSPKTPDLAGISDNSIISEKNLFSPDRKYVEKAGGNGEPVSKSKPDIILYGTIVDRDRRLAFVEDRKNPYYTPGRGKRHKVLKIGDEISGFRVTRITENALVLSADDESYVYNIEEFSKFKHGTKSSAAGTKKSRKTIKKRRR